MTKKKKKNNTGDCVQLIPLGGVGEIGKNMFLVKYREEIIVLDAGLAFPEEEMLGVDVVIPDISYLIENREQVKGIILTHGHEDHIGAVPYILPELNVPIWGTRLTLGLLKAKLSEFPHIKDVALNEIYAGTKLNITSSFEVEFFRTNHSIPDSVGVIISTPPGIIVYTSDFKFDQTPVNGLVTDYNRLAELGKRGVLVMLSDSTNAERPGYTLSEKEVGKNIDDIFRTAGGRIIVATFASNIHRIQQVVDAAVFYKRKIGVTGRSLVNSTSIARELDYLRIPQENIVELEKLNSFPPEKVVIITTGSQGEPMSALTRIANSGHRQIAIKPGDTVVIAASPIPGNEKLVSRTVDNLFKKGAEVHYQSLSGVHVSGHGSEEDLKLMLNLVQPSYLIPVHGEYRHMVHHAKIARKIGLPEENIFVIENGTVLDIYPDNIKVSGSITSGKVMVDGYGIGDVGNVVLRDRRVLSQDGIVVALLMLDQGRIISGPEIITRGFVYVRESETLLEEARNCIVNHFNSSADTILMKDWNSIKNSLRELISRFFWEKTGRKPIILPVIMEIDTPERGYKVFTAL